MISTPPAPLYRPGNILECNVSYIQRLDLLLIKRWDKALMFLDWCDTTFKFWERLFVNLVLSFHANQEKILNIWCQHNLPQHTNQEESSNETVILSQVYIYSSLRDVMKLSCLLIDMTLLSSLEQSCSLILFHHSMLIQKNTKHIISIPFSQIYKHRNILHWNSSFIPRIVLLFI